MDETTASTRGIRLVRHEDDEALVARGSIIPLALSAKPRPSSVQVRPVHSLFVLSLAIAMTLFGISAVYAPLIPTLVNPDRLVATLMPAAEVMLQDPETGLATKPALGSSLRYANEEYYEATVAALATAGVSFVALDLPKERLRFFDKGVLTTDAPVLHTPAYASWCTVLPGMYEVISTRERHYVPAVDLVLPQSVVFGGNQIIHGELEQAESASAEEAGCVTLPTAAATSLMSAVTEGTLVMVRASAPAPKQSMVFESKVPNFPTPYYLIADAQSDTVLAVGDTHAAVPIASLTKLMTALVVLESVPLDTMLAVSEPSLITSMIPRLRARSEVSAYTLLELLLVESSNEAAEVLASVLGREEFIARMNERALALGLYNTVFTDPAGIESTNVSSVHDLWWLMRYLREHYPFLIDLTAETAVPPATVADQFDALTNFNLLETDPTFIGGKIGETDAAGQTSVTIHRLSFGGTTREVVIVLLGSNARSHDVGELLTYLQERFGQ